jgi:hypothetical protein
MQNVQVCPACGQSDAIVQEVEDAQVAKCPHCQCEFPPHMESVSRKVIRRISEHRQRRMIRLAEGLPLIPPVGGLDPTDYALFRKIVNGVTHVKEFVPNTQNIEAAMQQVKDRFIDQRVNGYQHPETGEWIEPITPEDAEQRWVRVEPRFRAIMSNPNKQQADRLALGQHKDEWQHESVTA